jgi:hypothetical protein
MHSINMLKAKTAVVALALIVGTLSVSSVASAQVGYGGGGSSGGKGGIGGGGAGGGASCFQSLTPPAEGFRVQISNENGTVFSRLVQLTISPGSARRMAISNDASFSNASIEPANGSKDWTLSEGEGAKLVYVRFYDECGISTTPVSAGVIFNATRPAPATPAPGATSTDGGVVLGERINQVDELIAALRYGRRDARVLTLQNELVRLGFMPRGWRSTNYYGPVTLAAVTRYVDRNNADVAEMIGRLRFGQTHPDVRRLSRQLIAGGFMSRGSRISSYYGTTVRNAVARYQASR